MPHHTTRTTTLALYATISILTIILTIDRTLHPLNPHLTDLDK